MRKLFLFVFLLFLISANAQKIILSGKVTELNTGKALAGVVVTVRPIGQNKVLKFTTSESDGKYTLVLNSIPDGDNVLHFSMMGYATIIVPLTNEQTEYDVTLTEKVTELKGVKIKAPSIRQKGDTISYNVASFADANDKSLSDVLKKMPGVEVQDDGRIKYNGKEINKFYIEGHDMLGGRYSIATNNIHQEDVGAIEFMTNHQPIKALEDMVFSENPAINIKLKETAKGRWTGTIKMGAGAENKELVWNGELALMRFAKKIQSLSTFKSNNTGTDIVSEVNLKFDDFDGGRLGNTYSLNNYVSAIPDKLIEISDSRVRDNETHTFTTNNLFAISDYSDVTTQITYINDRLTSSAISSTQYILNDTIFIREDNEHAIQKQKESNIKISLTTNKEKAFITNKLCAELKWNDVSMDIVQDGHSLCQIAEMPSYKFYDNFEILLRRGQKAYAFDTYNVYMRNPHSLSVANVNQNVYSSAYFNHTHTSLGFFVNPFTISMEVGIQALYRSLESYLIGITDSSLFQNDVRMTFMRTYASPTVEFNNKRWHIEVKIPFTYTPYVFKDNLEDSREINHKVQVSPSMYVSCDFNNHLKGGLYCRISQRELDEQNFFQGLIMHDYKNLYRGFIDYTEDKIKSVTYDMEYKRPLQTIFMNAYVSMGWTDRHQTMARDFMDDYIVNSYYSDKSKSEVTLAGGRISKGLGFMRGLISANFDYMMSGGTMRQEDMTSNYTSKSYTWSAKWNGRPLQRFSFIYAVEWNKSIMYMNDHDYVSETTDQSQKLSLNFHLTEQWYVKLVGDYFRNQVAKEQHKNLCLADISTSCNLKNGVEFSITVFNLLGQQTYGYTTNESLTRKSKEYMLRGRTIIGSMFFHF